MFSIFTRIMDQENKKIGRPLGSPNKVTSQVRNLLSSWLETELANIGDLYSKLSHKEKARFITNILPFVIPKMKEVEVSLTSIPEDQIELMIEKLIKGDY
jgi:hypothetical protein